MVFGARYGWPSSSTAYVTFTGRRSIVADAIRRRTGGDFMRQLGFYREPEKVGYIGWIETIDGMYFIALDGKISKPSM